LRLVLLGGALVLLAACKGKGDEASMTVVENEAVTATRSTTEVRMSSGVDVRTASTPGAGEGTGKIIDDAGLIDAGEINAMSQELAEINRLGGPRVTMVLVRPTSGESMEQIGWALAGRPAGRALVLLADPGSGAVRIEGAVSPENKARIAVAMQQQLKTGKPTEALRGAIAILRGSK
jgi:uncharacterized membrane protein YgcG